YWQSDVWSAGVIFYEMLNRNLPFQGANMNELFAAIQMRPPVEMSASIPQPVQAVIRTALEKEADRRFRSARAMKDALLASLSVGINADSASTQTMGAQEERKPDVQGVANGSGPEVPGVTLRRGGMLKRALDGAEIALRKISSSRRPHLQREPLEIRREIVK